MLPPATRLLVPDENLGDRRLGGAQHWVGGGKFTINPQNGENLLPQPSRRHAGKRRPFGYGGVIVLVEALSFNGFREKVLSESIDSLERLSV